MSVVKMYLALAGSTWQWAAGHRSAAQGLSVICSGGGSVVMVLVALAVEFRTSPKSPPAGLAPPTLDFKFSTFSSNDLKVGEFFTSSSFLVMTEPTDENAAEAFCPACDRVSEVFLYALVAVTSCHPLAMFCLNS